MYKGKRGYKFFVIVLVLVATVVATGLFIAKTSAETSGSSPESGSTSRIKTLYDSLVSLGFGTDTDSPDWGTYWNRIKTAASFTPGGNASVADVKSGKTFYSNSRTLGTGTYLAPSGCSTQQYQSSYGSATSENNCSITWTTASPVVTGDDKQDPRTGLVWSKYLQNSGGTAVFVTSSGSSWTWDASGGSNVAVGNRTAAQVCSDKGNGWRLPSQIELQQAHIDGSYWNLTNPNLSYWAITESPAFNAWKVSLGDGYTAADGKSSGYYLRCVR